MQTVYLHVGYHKTATTFMQQSIFPNMKNVNYIHPEHIMEDLRRLRLNKLTDEHMDSLRDYFDSFTDEKPLLISYEGLSGSPFAPKKVKRQTAILKDLRRLFPSPDYDVYILVGLREQVDLLTSLYVQHIHQGGVMSAAKFIEYCRHNESLQNFHYHSYLKTIEELFGEDHLHIMVYEHFRRDSTNELMKLLNFMGEPDIPDYKAVKSVRKMNKSFGTMQVAAGRQMNRLFKTPIHPEGPLALIKLPHRNYLPTRYILQNKLSYWLHYKKYQLPDSLQSDLKAVYADSNAALSEDYELNLPESYFKQFIYKGKP